MSNEIIQYTPQPTTSLVEVRRDNLRFPRLHSYPKPVAHKMMMALVLKANDWFGCKPDMGEVTNIAWDLYNELMNDVEGLRTFNITFEEINRAIKKAATGQSIDFYGKVSFYYLYKCIMHYVKNDVMAANTQMLRLAETNKEQLYREKTQFITGASARQMLEHSQIK
jgi:hypothetical protein